MGCVVVLLVFALMASLSAADFGFGEPQTNTGDSNKAFDFLHLRFLYDSNFKLVNIQFCLFVQLMR